jgi:aminoglycoside phosphotransferase (APT) family kinase protein
VTQSSTHVLDRHGDVVIKRYVSWDQDQPDREWWALTLLAEHAPELAPAPISADLHGAPPAVTMTWLSGTPLEPGTIVTPAQLKALAKAITRLHDAIPADQLAGLPPRKWNPAAILAHVRARSAAKPYLGDDQLVAEAFAAASTWASVPQTGQATAKAGRLVLGQADGNLANFLWDGAQQKIRLVDFEDSGVSDPIFEIAEITEHLTSWTADAINTADFLEHLPLTDDEAGQLQQFRRLLAFWWLLMLLPDQPYHARNPQGTLRRQAARLLTLLH